MKEAELIRRSDGWYVRHRIDGGGYSTSRAYKIDKLDISANATLADAKRAIKEWGRS